jgi:hypothetical protein
MATIAAKLAASEREADAARVRAKLRAVRSAGKKLNTLATGAPFLPHPTRGPNDGGGVSLEPSAAEAHRQNGGSGKQGMQYDDNEDEDDDDDDNDKNEEDDDDDDEDDDDDVDNEAIEDDDEEDEDEDEDPEEEPQQQQQAQPLVVAKRKRAGPAAGPGNRVVSKAAHRRRSTLSPWELQSLMTGSAAAAPPIPSHARS